MVELYVQKIRFRQIGKLGNACLNYERSIGRYSGHEGPQVHDSSEEGSPSQENLGIRTGIGGFIAEEISGGENTQQKDIRKAQEYWQDFKERTKKK